MDGYDIQGSFEKDDHFTKLLGYETFAHRTCRHVTRDSHGTPEITGTL